MSILFKNYKGIHVYLSMLKDKQSEKEQTYDQRNGNNKLFSTMLKNVDKINK